jgi:hypothetical protein
MYKHGDRLNFYFLATSSVSPLSSPHSRWIRSDYMDQKSNSEHERRRRIHPKRMQTCASMREEFHDISASDEGIPLRRCVTRATERGVYRICAQRGVFSTLVSWYFSNMRVIMGPEMKEKKSRKQHGVLTGYAVDSQSGLGSGRGSRSLVSFFFFLKVSRDEQLGLVYAALAR